jgi:hypothetical protein
LGAFFLFAFGSSGSGNRLMPQTKKKKKAAVASKTIAKKPQTVSRVWRWAIGLALVATAAGFVVWKNWPKAKTVLPPFSGQNAFALLQKQCDFGPRVPGTAAHDSCRVFLLEELRRYAENVVEQGFEHQLERYPQPVKLTNLIAGFQLDAPHRVLLCAHWDSRPWADQETDSAEHQLPVPGANDGASGVAVLLEIARLLKAVPPPIGVDLVLFDGEDSGISGMQRTFAIGAQHFARAQGALYHPQFGILLDMVGDRDLQIYQEGNSARYARGLVDHVWQLAREQAVAEFIPTVRHEVFDDHYPLIEAGIPVIDLIDFDYPHWHTLDDTPDKCSPASLEKVGKVVLAAVYDRRAW